MFHAQSGAQPVTPTLVHQSATHQTSTSPTDAWTATLLARVCGPFSRAICNCDWLPTSWLA